MGQKVHPGGLRVGVIHDWKSNWMVGKKEFAGALIEDIKIREHILKRTCHITVQVAQNPAAVAPVVEPKPKRRATRKKTEETES